MRMVRCAATPMRRWAFVGQRARPAWLHSVVFDRLFGTGAHVAQDVTAGNYTDTEQQEERRCKSSGSVEKAHSLPARANSLCRSARRGRVTAWHPWERHGRIREEETGVEFLIANTRAFETVLSSTRRDITGAAVEFVVDTVPDADRVMVRRRVDPITATSYAQQPPYDFARAPLLDIAHNNAQQQTTWAHGHTTCRTTTCADKHGRETHSCNFSDTAGVLYAKQIVILAHENNTALTVARETCPTTGLSLATHTATMDSQPGDTDCMTHTGDGNNSNGKQDKNEVIQVVSGLAEHDGLGWTVPPTRNLKDLRSCRLFDRETNARLKLRRRLGDGPEAQAQLEQLRRMQEDEHARQAGTIVQSGVLGRVTAWSTIHRSGFIAELDHDNNSSASVTQNNVTPIDRASKDGEDKSKDGDADRVNEEHDCELGGSVVQVSDASLHRMCIIRSAHCFVTALPTSRDLKGCRVRFDKVCYPASQPVDRFFAESIVVLADEPLEKGESTLQGALSSCYSPAQAHEAAKDAAKHSALRQRARRFGCFFAYDEEGIIGAQHDSNGSHSTSITTDSDDKNSTDMDDTATKTARTAQQHYGVIARWSGRQGVVQSSTGISYFVRSPADVATLLSHNSRRIRGALVSFTVHPDSPRYARTVTVLHSTMQNDTEAVQALVERVSSQLPQPPRRRAGVTTQTRATNESGLCKEPRVCDSDIDSSVVCTTRTQVFSDPDTKSADGRGEKSVWMKGYVVVWSTQEEQGIIESIDDGQRYVVRDAAETVERYMQGVKEDLQQRWQRWQKKRRCHSLVSTDASATRMKERQNTMVPVRFVPGGRCGRTAMHVVLLPRRAKQRRRAQESNNSDSKTEKSFSARNDVSSNHTDAVAAADEECDDDCDEEEEDDCEESEVQLRELQNSLDGNVNEAVPSPMCTSYWIKRMDKAGYDVNEVKQMQNRAFTLNELDDDDDDVGDSSTHGGRGAVAKRKSKFLDSEEIMKSDHWWTDPRKNIRLPNSDVTAGHLALIGPASMMNYALKAKDPGRLDRMTRKYQARLTEEQKEYAWNQAKELAPKYEALIKKARERNEEPTFHFF